MRYFSQTKNFMLVHSNCNEREIVGYANSDFAGSLDDIKSISGYVFKLAGEKLLNMQ